MSQIKNDKTEKTYWRSLQDKMDSKEIESSLFYEALKYIGVVVEGNIDGKSNHAMA